MRILAPARVIFFCLTSHEIPSSLQNCKNCKIYDNSPGHQRNLGNLLKDLQGNENCEIFVILSTINKIYSKGCEEGPDKIYENCEIYDKLRTKFIHRVAGKARTKFTIFRQIINKINSKGH